MAGLEIVVRPLIFPDIRPIRSRPALPPEDDPTKGFAVIQGDPTVSTSTSDSWSITSSHSRPVEKERRVDETRIYQQDDNGDVQHDNFIDVDVANRITMEEPGGGHQGDVPYGEGGGGSGGGELTTGKDNVDRKYFYQRQLAAPNIEIRKKDQIRKAPAPEGGSE